jgi:beta-glucanase (GH16 family)
MSKKHVLLGFALLSLLACKKKDVTSSQTPGKPTENKELTLSLGAATLNFSEKDSTQSVTVLTNANEFDVSTSVGNTWCTASKAAGKVNIKVSPMNSTLTNRNTMVTITVGSGAEKQLKTVIVNQKREWKLVFEDDFNTNGNIDATKWTLQTKGSPDWNKYMNPSNDMAFVQGGSLILKARKTANGYETSGINSSDKFNFKYGKVEVRAKLSSGQGTWPAIWMMPQTSVYGGWPKSGEIDIMEHLSNDANIYQVIHSHYVDNLGIKNNPTNVATPGFNVGAFNTFGIEWFPDRIDYYLNDKLTFSYPKKAGLSPDQLQWPFDQSFYLILNQALGGSWVGRIDDAILPVQTEVDYVKVYGLSNY